MSSDTPRTDALEMQHIGCDAFLDPYGEMVSHAQDLERENAALTAELAESARLHAMGSEREARLTARVAELKAALRQASLCIREHVPVGNDRGFTLTIINAALKAARGTE